MTKLWEKGYKLDELIESYTVGDDYKLDVKLVKYDCLASIAHAKMLEKIGILTSSECTSLVNCLQEIKELNIERHHEDCHTAIENYLIEKLGDVGKKIHTARSRNDQVLVALRLYSKDELDGMKKTCLLLAQTLTVFAKKYHKVALPGRTHTQLAMPSSLGLWAGAFAESMLDNIKILQNAYELSDQCPLGSAASYGVALPIDRQMTSDLLGFAKVQNNVLYCNNSRGKFEAAILHALVQVMNDLSKMSSDLILFSLPEIKYVSLPKEMCLGSSLMPQKKNPCSLELMRAKAATVSSYLMQVFEIIRPLVSGYNRDFQETKAPLMNGFDTTLSSILVMIKTIEGLNVHTENCLKAFTGELFATDLILQKVVAGVPFRTAYQQVAAEIENVEVCDPVANILSKTHIGATGNLGLDLATMPPT